MGRALAVLLVAWALVGCATVTAQQRVTGTTLRPLVLDANGRPIGSWVAGTVRDDLGRPVVGAKVYAAATFNPGIRTYEAVGVGTTNAEGKYTVSGELGLESFSATLVVVKQGLVPAFGWFDLPAAPAWGQPRPALPASAPPVRDFVVTDRGGELDVVVTADGRAVNGATVEIRRAGGELRQMWAYPTRDAAQGEAEAIAYPKATTRADGTAHFASLVPGCYGVNVTGPVPPRADGAGRLLDRRDELLTASADAVPVQTGVTAVQHIAIYAHPQEVRIRSLDKDGKPHPSQDQQLSVGTVAESGWMTPATTGPDGTTTCSLEGMGDRGEPGLYTIELKPSPGGGTSWSMRDAEFPHDAAAGWVGSSALLEVVEPFRFTTRTISPATIDVGVFDTDGRPVDGPVSINRESYQYAATKGTDAAGHARFTGVPDGRFHVWAGPPQDFTAFDTGPVPADPTLLKRVIPPLTAAIEPDEHCRLTLRAVPAGHVRGVLIPPAGVPLTSLGVYPEEPAYGPARVRLDERTGAFVAGPYAAGSIRLRVAKRDPLWNGPALVDADADIIAGQVVHVLDVAPPPPGTDDDPAEPRVFVGMGGIFQRGTVTADVRGRVFMPDRRTPASFAQVEFFSGDSDRPVGDGLTDAGGTIHTRGLWATPPSVGLATGRRTVIALIPGAVGGTVADLSHVDGQPLSIVLPPSRAVHGRMTIGGRSPAGVHAQGRVLAGHLHGGRGDGLLSLEATPQDDGSFALAGLTPGDYLVQASVDNIWLSASVPLHVSADRDPPDVSLDVPAPAGPVAVTVVDQAGKPLVGWRLTVDRPAGPLTAVDWPDHFTTDGAGVAYIPAMEAGPHAVHVGRAVVTVTPPTLPCEAAATARCVVGPADGE